MVETDFEQFCAMFDGAYEAKNRTLTANTKALFFAALRKFSIEAVGAALTAHLLDPEKGEWPPMPANIVAQINAAAGRDGRPTADEGWATSLRALDEHETVVWTSEMHQAFELARPVLERRDSIGARRAFIDAYNRLVDEARRTGTAPRWTVSPGRNAARRELVLQQAVEAGLLPPPEGFVPAALLAGPDTDHDIDREGLARVKAEVAKLIPASEKLAKRRAAQIEAERLAVAQQKARIAEAARQYAEEHCEAFDSDAPVVDMVNDAARHG